MTYKGDWKKWEIEIEGEVLEAKVRHLNIYNDKVIFPDGRTWTYVRIVPQRKDPFTCIWIIQNQEGKVLLIKEFRHAVRKFSRSFPMWANNTWDTPEQTCRREIFEETWLDIADRENIGSTIPYEAFINVPFHYFYWKITDTPTLLWQELSEAIVDMKNLLWISWKRLQLVSEI